MEAETDVLIKTTKTIDVHQIKRCLPQGMKVKRRRRCSASLRINTPLEVKNVTIIKLLIEYSKSDKCDWKNHNILHCVVKQGNLDIVRFLLEQYPEISINDTDSESLTPLYIATENKHIHVMKYLLSKDADANVCCQYKERALHKAASLGSLEMVNLLLKYNAEVNVFDEYEYSPLGDAVNNDHIEVAKVLIRAGTDLNHKNICSKTVLYSAVYDGMIELVVDLIQHGINITQDEHLMHVAIGNDNFETVKILHQAGISLTNVNQHGETPLMEACSYAQFSVAEYLLQNGVSPNTMNESDGRTALHYCISRNEVHMFRKYLKLFLHYDVILEQKSCKGENAFSHAICITNFMAPRLLIKYGFDINCINDTWVEDSLNILLCFNQISFEKEYVQKQLKYLFDLVKLVFCAGFDYKNLEISKDLDDGRIYNFIAYSMSKPRSLKDLCRIKIRKLCGNRPMGKLYQLPLPKRIQDFLALHIL